ncbi:T6SS immunity protein Tdi1 domain-containing protein [Enterococcus larvae]|uniref:T6SS immunity protein Tdi1 domain-containing protein n=1 Tax=Enterococcus larvae TaxID=2794352 RepID=UPI003F3F4F8F
MKLSSNSTDYGFVPLLPLGGIENVEHLDVVKLKEHVLINSQMFGKLDSNISFVEIDFTNGLLIVKHSNNACKILGKRIKQ